MKQYLLQVQERVSEHEFGQLAVEHAIFTGRLKLTYNLETDANLAATLYDHLCNEYRDYCHNGPRPIELEFFKADPGAFAFHASPVTTNAPDLPDAPSVSRPVASRPREEVVR